MNKRIKEKFLKYIYKKIQHYFPTKEEKEPCPKCGSKMRHLIHQDSNMSAEARFECVKCYHVEFRGGTGSEIWLEKIYFLRQKNLILKKIYPNKRK